MASDMTVWGYDWVGPSKSKISQNKMVPSDSEWPAIRWTSDRDGALEIVGEYSLRLTKKVRSDGVMCLIYADGKKIFSEEIKPLLVNHTYTEKFKVSADAKKGSTIDFVVTPGRENNAAGDHVMLDASICVPAR